MRDEVAVPLEAAQRLKIIIVSRVTGTAVGGASSRSRLSKTSGGWSPTPALQCQSACLCVCVCHSSV